MWFGVGEHNLGCWKVGIEGWAQGWLSQRSSVDHFDLSTKAAQVGASRDRLVGVEPPPIGQSNWPAEGENRG